VEAPESVQALIAARLDTLPAERKSLLQDASVLGKVFWSGALAAMGGRDPVEVEQALHELARKELVRASRTSSMEDEHEYGFWHVLVRDVCYGQIPRAARAARHRAAAAWIEEKAGERVEDLADVLSHHYQTALELTRAAGIGEHAEQLQAQAVRYLGLAGERALSLDVDQAERQLALALELAPPGDPTRAQLLERWAQAVQQQGRLQDARQVLEQALDLYREQGEPVAAGRVLTRLGLVVHRLGDPRSEQMLAEARDLLEAQPAGPELVSTYAYVAGRCMFGGRNTDAVAAAEQALALAAELGLPEPAFALHWRGLARCGLGEADGVEDVRRALQLALDQSLGRETGVIYGNLSGVVWSYQGPQAALDLCGEAIAFCERRGIAELALQNRASTPAALAELGQAERALAEAEPVADRLQAAGDMGYVSARAVQLRLLAERGIPEQAPVPDELVAAARGIGLPGLIALAFGAAAQLLFAQGRREEARALLQELDQLDVTRLEVAGLPSLLRVALALDDPPLARRLAAGVEPATSLDDHAVVSAEAQLAEAAGRHADAARLYQQAAERWHQFGNVPERAYALLGRGRCLVALGDVDSEVPLTEARDLFASMGYKPALAETERLLAGAVASTG
jgi:tetratricopeptide (TPR) repeat protein